MAPLGTIYKSKFLSLNWINNIYISCPNIGCFETIFAGFGRGENNILKKIPITSSYGFANIDIAMAANDFLSCSKQSFQTLEFHLKTASGIYVPLHGAHVTFSIIFNSFDVD